MLAMIIVIFPIVMALLFYYKSNNKITLSYQLAAYILYYTLSTNFVILIGLKLIGMQKFNLFQMSTHFKIKWLILEITLTMLGTYILRNLLQLNRTRCKDTLLKVLPTAFLLIVTYAIYIPSSLFLGNIEEFSLHYIHIVPSILCMSVILITGVCVLALCMTNEKNIVFCTSIIFAIALGIYVQSNFLNPKLPSLDGTEINWMLYQKENRISLCCWVLCIIILPVCALIMERKTEKIMKYTAYFLSAVQLMSLLVLIYANRLDEQAHYDFTKTGEFSIGHESNILLFVVDAVQADAMEEYLTSDAYLEDWLENFTFFDNSVSGGAPTSLAFPLLLTGVEYDPEQPLEEYMTEIWDETLLYNDLRDHNYDVRFYTEGTSISDYPKGMIANFIYNGGVGIDNYLEFSSRLYQLANFYCLPQCVKEYFWLTTDDFKGSIAYSNNGYKVDDVRFYEDLQSASYISKDYERSFRLYHLCGVHKPYTINENVENVEKNSVTEQQVLAGDMKIIHKYIEYLKTAGLYESSTIMIMGDHGRHEAGCIEDNPAVLIKLPGESHALAHSSSPIHFRNIVATIARSVVEDYSAYGPCVYDITEDSDVERLHTIDTTVRSRIAIEEDYDASLKYTRFMIMGDAGAGIYRVWNPYTINRIRYKLGGTIDFVAENEYAEAINYRLYKENNTAVASNELSMCFDFDNYRSGDLTLHFTYSDVWNKSQKIWLYAGGNKIETVVCIQEDAGKEHIVVVPEDSIKDGVLSLRMVFPNAVTPNQLDRNNPDTRVLSVAFDCIWFT